jgi:DNA-binding transcriptional ArsR family regulator
MPARPRKPAAPTGTVRLDARNLRGLAHPVRVRMLGLLRTDGPSTATRLGERLGLSSAATSYHLRQLADHGFIVDDPEAERSHGRERWWRAAARGTVLDHTPDDPDARLAAQEYLRAIAGRYTEVMHAWLDEMETAPPAWRGVSNLSDVQLRLTPAETVELNRRLDEILSSMRRHEPGKWGPRGSELVTVQWQVVPRPGPHR